MDGRPGSPRTLADQLEPRSSKKNPMAGLGGRQVDGHEKGGHAARTTRRRRRTPASELSEPFASTSSTASAAPRQRGVWPLPERRAEPATELGTYGMERGAESAMELGTYGKLERGAESATELGMCGKRASERASERCRRAERGAEPPTARGTHGKLESRGAESATELGAT